MVESLDIENPEYLFLGDLNVDFNQSVKFSYRDKLNEIFIFTAYIIIIIIAKPAN